MQLQIYRIINDRGLMYKNSKEIISHGTLGHAKSICSFSGPRAWKLAAL